MTSPSTTSDTLAGLPTGKFSGDRSPHRENQRESGISWIGHVPAHWTVDRLRWTIADAQNGIWGDEPDGLNDIICVRVVDFDRTTLTASIDEPTMRAVTPSERRGRVLQRGDLLLEKSGGGELQPVGAVVEYDHDAPAVCSNFVARVRVACGFDARFLVYLHSHLYTGRVNTRSVKQTTGIQNLDSMAYFDERVCWPPLPEQQAIAGWLDERTRRIDDLVAAKRRLIDRLDEQRTALITHAVTKGLSPAATMKPSGIDWLGSVIPAHWVIHHLRRVVRVFVDYRGRTPDKTDSGVPLITAGAIKGGRIDHSLSPEYMAEADYHEWMQRGWPERGDVVITTEAPLGEVALVEDINVAFAQRVILLKVNRERMLPEYLRYYYLSQLGEGELKSRASGSTAAGIRADRLRGSLVVVPPLDEQAAIVALLDTKLAAMSRPIATTETAIARLTEYRQALISAAVTGKIDVRSHVPEMENL